MKHGVPNAHKTTVELAKNFVKNINEISGPSTLDRIFFIETHKINEETIPGFFINEQGESEFDLEDGNYEQTTLELVSDDFKISKEDKPQLVYKGKFLNSSFEYIFDFGNGELYFIGLEEFKKGNGAKKDKTVIKDAGGAVDPMDSNKQTEDSKLIFAQAAIREFGEEVLGLNFDGEDNLKNMLELMNNQLSNNGQFKILNKNFMLNMNDSLERLPRTELNHLCVATATFAIRVTYEKNRKDQILHYLESLFTVEQGKKSQPKIFTFSEFIRLKEQHGKSLQDRTKLQDFVNKINFAAFDISALIESILTS